jgi:hypothetical protein
VWCWSLHPIEDEQNRHRQSDRQHHLGLIGRSPTDVALPLAATGAYVNAHDDLAAAMIALGHLELDR